jgi:AmmeMemoRadiSam system protein B/AmmeMemoRadiSam system protein A
MKRDQKTICLLILVCLLFASTIPARQKTAPVRPPAVAGQFYSANAARLKLGIRQFLEEALPARVEKPVAIVVPHAGYLYAGQIIADGYRQIIGQVFDTVVILGTNHGRNQAAQSLTGISVYPGGAYRTPLGEAPVDADLAQALLAEDSDCASNIAAQAAEHSIEVQVPFVQVLFPSARILPVMIGTPDPSMCARLGQTLAKVGKGKRVLLVASTDLSHFPGYEDASAVDLQTLEAITRLDPAQFVSKLRALTGRSTPGLETCACGEGPILAVMAAAKALGAGHGIAVSYANSGDAVAQDRLRVVGYGAVVYAAGPGTPDLEALRRPAVPLFADPLLAADKKALLKIARQTLQRFLSTETIPLARNLPARLRVPQGAFVTLKQHGELRGCIGHLTPDFPLSLVTGWMAVQAGMNDPRFPAVTLNELSGLEIEISAMTPMKPVAKSSEIVVGRDGVVIQKGGRSAVFLPQVATEQGWGLSEMLDNLSLKAGLPRDAWKSGAQFRVFQADVFGESQFK